jgi:DNA repair protein RecO (recombination protein O)
MLTNEGIIIKTIPYQEQAKIATMLTMSGKETFIIRGASKIKSKNRAISQILNVLSFQATTKGTLRTMTESHLIKDYEHIKMDFEKMQSVYPILEKCDHFAEQANDTKTLYEFTKYMLDSIEQSPYHHSLRNLFELKLTYLLGIGPNFQVCNHCGKLEDLKFVPTEGGVLCQSCLEPSMLAASNQMTTLIKYLYLIKPEKMSSSFLETVEPFAKEIEELIDTYYDHFLGFQSASKRVVRRMNK